MVKNRYISNQCFIKLIQFYRFAISPCLGQRCRFIPTCSEYAHDAFQQYAFLKAISIIIGRLLRCHPFCPGGYDPLPSNKKSL